MLDLRRRRFIALLGAAAAWPLAARAQQPASMPLVGFLNGGSAAAFAELVGAFRRGLQDAGYVEGQNVSIAYRWAEGRYDRLPMLAAELVNGRVAVIASTGGPDVVEAAAAATSTIPIVFLGSDNVLKKGVSTSLNRPSGNVTGVAMSATALLSKCLQFLDELTPKDKPIGVLLNPNSSTTADDKGEIQAAARQIGRTIFIVTAANETEIDTVFAALAERQAGGLVVQGDILFTNRRADMVARAARQAIPAIYVWSEFTARPDRVWKQSGGGLCPGRRLYRTDSAWRKTGRPADHAAHPLPVDHQSQNRQGARSRHTGIALDLGRRGDRVSTRRQLITLLGGAAATWPLAARAQQQAMPVIGFLNNQSLAAYSRFVAAFRQGLRQIGYVENQNVLIQYGWGQNDSSRLPALAAELVRVPAAVLVASGGDPAISAAKAATTTIPIVATIGNDPVETGLVQSLNRPGGNLTGVSVFAVQLVAKRLELAHELVPKSAVVGFLANPGNPNSKIDTAEIDQAARTLGHEAVILEAATESECEAVFISLRQRQVAALIVESDPFFNKLTDRLVALAQRHSIPVVYPRREFTSAGGLMSYGSSLTEAYRQVGIYVGRILKGDKPSDLPILLPSKFELVVNLKTANSFGLTMPTSILLRADEVIE